MTTKYEKIETPHATAAGTTVGRKRDINIHRQTAAAITTGERRRRRHRYHPSPARGKYSAPPSVAGNIDPPALARLPRA